jgi:hypothetical protein
MARRDDYQNQMRQIEIKEIKHQLDGIPLAPLGEESKGRGDYQFRPLTQKERKEFIASLDAKGKRIFTELAGIADSSPVEAV